MSPRLATGLAAAGAGLLFGAGLLLSGMADPARVLAFLTLGPGWDPALAFVMAGAIAVTLPGYAWLQRRGKPFLHGAFAAHSAQAIDRRLIVGATIFGAGWGLAGYCPGPAIVAASLAEPAALLFLPAMIAGAALADHFP